MYFCRFKSHVERRPTSRKDTARAITQHKRNSYELQQRFDLNIIYIHKDVVFSTTKIPKGIRLDVYILLHLDLYRRQNNYSANKTIMLLGRKCQRLCKITKPCPVYLEISTK